MTDPCCAARPFVLDCPSLVQDALAEWGYPAYRFAQIQSAAWRGQEFDAMLQLPAALRQQLAERFDALAARLVRRHPSADGTVKYLTEMADGERIESVRMRYNHGDTLCLSTQAGCRMGCAFCASTMEGLARNLTSGEILGQAIAAAEDERRNPLTPAQPGDKKPMPLRNFTNLVLMGSGEPLDNPDAVFDFIRRVSDPAGFGVSVRNISLSTCGLPEGIDALIAQKLPVTLCWSMHAPDDPLRRSLMPGAAARGSIDAVLAALRRYVQATGRRVIIEYILIDGVNDSRAQAKALAARLRGLNCHINLIPLNPVPGRPFATPPAARIAAFNQALQQSGLSVSQRRTLGDDVLGACGQLRRQDRQQRAPTP